MMKTMNIIVIIAIAMCHNQFQIGEYFGAEIVTMAVVPRQRYSQVVLIAAPLHTEGDREGRVYVCTLTASVSHHTYRQPMGGVESDMMMYSVSPVCPC